MIDLKLVSTYSFLALLNENVSDRKDYVQIFEPIVKYALSSLCDKGKNQGASLLEINKEVLEKFQIEFPIPLLKLIIARIEKEINLKNSNSFITYEDGSYQINKYVFTDYDDERINQNRSIEKLIDFYNTYLISQGLEPTTQPSIFDFIIQNRVSISSLLAKDEHQAEQTLFYHQANFVDRIKSYPELYTAIRKIYLGSIISTYLSFEVKNVTSNFEFILDTNFLVALLDLNTEESHHTCLKIIDISKRLGHKITVLDLTLNETKHLIETHADNFDSSLLSRYVNRESIYYASQRRNLTSTDLYRISANIEEKIRNEFQFNVVENSEKYQNEAKALGFYKKFLKIRNEKARAALHDATAVAYVWYKRNKKVVSRFEDAKIWFVTNTSIQSRFDFTDGLSQIIRAEELVSLLWLTSPMIKDSEIAEIGLTQLISTAIHNSLPNSKLLRELDDRIKKYAGAEISEQDYYRLSQLIANRTITNLNDLVNAADSNTAEFIEKVKRYSLLQHELEKKRERDVVRSIEEIQETKERELLEMQKRAAEELTIVYEIATEDVERNKKALYKGFEIEVNANVATLRISDLMKFNDIDRTNRSAKLALIVKIQNVLSYFESVVLTIFLISFVYYTFQLHSTVEKFKEYFDPIIFIFTLVGIIPLFNYLLSKHNWSPVQRWRRGMYFLEERICSILQCSESDIASLSNQIDLRESEINANRNYLNDLNFSRS